MTEAVKSGNGNPKARKEIPNHVATTNACKLCTPLGASLAFHGIEGGLCLLHGSQGCSTYIRRYLISHFKEPLDIASSNFSENSAVYGGEENLKRAIENLKNTYKPKLIGVATTCLAETMGEDVPAMLKRLEAEQARAKEAPEIGEVLKGRGVGDNPAIVSVSTPSYRGTHADGFNLTIAAIVKTLAGTWQRENTVKTTTEKAAAREALRVNLFPGMASPADLRAIGDLTKAFGLRPIIVSDYSETLDGGLWDDYYALPPGGTSVESIRALDLSLASVELGDVLAGSLDETAAAYLQRSFGVLRHSLGLPIGVEASDRLFNLFADLSGKKIPSFYRKERSRLVDSYADGHKVVYGQRAVLYGEEDLVAALALFLDEIGMVPALVASGGKSGRLEAILRNGIEDFDEKDITVLSGADFIDIETAAEQCKPDILIGHSKGYKMSQSMKIPLLRLGFPIHDRFGAARQKLFCYEGTQELFDRIVNSLLEKRQDDNPVAYTYY